MSSEYIHSQMYGLVLGGENSSQSLNWLPCRYNPNMLGQLENYIRDGVSVSRPDADMIKLRLTDRKGCKNSKSSFV